jgi:succinate-semialdehyde dehydrogenase/glutarate-semialdehyde dehydrogenase
MTVFTSINPATEEQFHSTPVLTDAELEQALAGAARAAPAWAARPLAERAEVLREAAQVLRNRRDALARTVTLEMGKLFKEARAEIDKCALGCEYYAEHAGRIIADEVVPTDARRSLVAYQPLGTVLAIMPWNFPFWQVFRFAAPALAAGNTGLLKHASNVSMCAQAIEDVWTDAGAPPGVFTNLMLESRNVGAVIDDPRVHAVTLTGSTPAGRSVAGRAGAALKKTVLELGGSDPFIVLPDADLERTVPQAIASRFQNAGQSCIAAKRFIVHERIYDRFTSAFAAAAGALKPGDPLIEATTLAPVARGDLREELHGQVTEAVKRGARVLAGGAPVPGKGYFYGATVLDHLEPGMRVWSEELFGPVACVFRVRSDEEAIALANASVFGFGGSVWTQDLERGERVARALECGSAFVNMMVKSDPRVPFGGVKESGYGRELSSQGLREFVNVKSVWVE